MESEPVFCWRRGAGECRSERSNMTTSGNFIIRHPNCLKKSTAILPGESRQHGCTHRLVRLGTDSHAVSSEACKTTDRDLSFAALQTFVIQICAFATRAHFLCGFIPGSGLHAKADKVFAGALTRHEAASTNKRLTDVNSTLEWILLHRTTDCVLRLIVRGRPLWTFGHFHLSWSP